MKRILIADDERTVRLQYKKLFEAEGYAVDVAKDGEQALEKFFASPPDLLLLDVMMPKLNGIAVCEEIRRRDATTPVLFFTAMASEVTMIRGLGLGADDYVEKTRSPDEFVARVKSVFARKEAYESAARKARRTFRIADVEIDLSGMTARGPGVNERLTKQESILLGLFASDRGKFFSYGEMFDTLGYIGEEVSIRACLSRLKKKLGRAGNLIVNERRSGYALLP